MDNSSQMESASTTKPQLEMTEAVTSTRVLEARSEDPISHEPPLPPPKVANSAPQAGDEEANGAGAATGETQVPQTPQVFITFLVISGRRRTMSFEPETTLGRVKELVWNGWPPEWEDERPFAPSYLRVLYLGKMLQDDDTLSQLKFPIHTPQALPAPSPTIVHLSIRPHTAPGENDLNKKRQRNRISDRNTEPSSTNGGEQAGGAGCCNCIIC